MASSKQGEHGDRERSGGRKAMEGERSAKDGETRPRSAITRQGRREDVLAWPRDATGGQRKALEMPRDAEEGDMCLIARQLGCDQEIRKAGLTARVEIPSSSYQRITI